MNSGLLLAAGILVVTALAHSILGERYILTRLFRRDNLPRLFGSDWFTKRTLRFAWHITSVAWLAFAAILVLFARGTPTSSGMVLQVIAAAFFISAVIAVVGSRGRHLSWLAFLAIAVLIFFVL